MTLQNILHATPDEFTNDACKLNNESCKLSSEDSKFTTYNEFRNQKTITVNTRDKLCQSITGAIGELNQILSELSGKAKLGNDTSHINSMLYNSLILLIDELDYVAQYIEKIEGNIDMACFDIAKKLHESIVHLIGYRKDILFKVIETTYKIHDYIIK